MQVVNTYLICTSIINKSAFSTEKIITIIRCLWRKGYLCPLPHSRQNINAYDALEVFMPKTICRLFDFVRKKITINTVQLPNVFLHATPYRRLDMTWCTAVRSRGISDG